MVAYRRGGAFCKGIVNTARREGLPFAPAKGSKTGQRGTKLSPLQTPLTLSCAGYEYCFSLNNREKQIRTAHRCAPKVAAGASALSPYPLPRCGGGERGCEAEHRQWRMQRGGAPAAVEKNEQASSAKFFSGTARRRGQIRRGYLWSASVRSTDLFFPII